MRPQKAQKAQSMADWLRRVWHLLNRPRRERELVREMREHRASMSDASRFGDTHRLLEYSRDAWGWNWLDDAMQDLRLGLRGLMRSPVFTIAAILILSFGIGLNLTVFEVADAGLLRGPAIAHPETLARLHRHGESLRSNSEAVPYAAALAISRQNTGLSAVMMESGAPVVWGESASVIAASFVSANWFSQLGYAPLLGRVFTPQIDGGIDAAPVVIASYRFWANTLGGDPSVIGSSVRINDRAVTLIGVMSEKFPELDQDVSAIWLPIHQRDYHFPNSTFLTDWGSNNIAMYGRLKDGVSPAEVRESLRAVMAALHREHPQHVDAGEWLEPALAAKNFTEPAERLGFIGVASLLGLLSTMVLLVAAANLGNLVMSRATSRARELGVRVALGAGRWRIVRQLAMEAMPLGMAGVAGGIVLMTWATSTFAAFAQAPPYFDFSPDRSTVALSLVLAALALTVVAALPAWNISKQDLTDAIKDGGQQVSMRLDRARARSLMLAVQVGGSCVMLLVSAMMVRSLQNSLTADLGFKYEQSVVMQAGLGVTGIEGDAARLFWKTVKERIAANPATQAVALAVSPPFQGRRSPGYPEAPRLRVRVNQVDPGYFGLLEIPFVAGRTFEPSDDAAATVIISRTLAQSMYGSTDVVGQAFPRSAPHDTIVGVVGDTSAEKPGDNSSADVYRPISSDDYERVTLLARARTSPTALVGVMREAAQADSRVLVGLRLLRDDFDRRMAGMRIISSIAASIGVLTLLLACTGIFGVVSYGTALRTKELGIHLALGAGRGTVFRIVTHHVLTPVLAGMMLGSAAAMPIGFALTKSPLQLAFADPIAYGAGLLILAAGAATAALTPALRALGNDPLRALRHE
jgi:predicted permease